MPLKVIDWNLALEQVGGDEEFLGEVLRDLLDEAQVAQEKIAVGIEERNFLTVKQEAHKIKGSASYLSCDELRHYSLVMQDAGMAGHNGEDASKQWAIIDDAFDSYKEALKYLKKESESRK